MFEKIIVIDDDSTNVEHVTAILEEANYSVKYLTDFSKIYQILSEEVPDLILFNSKQTQTDGYEKCAELKKNPIYKNIPVLIICELSELDCISIIAEAEANDFVNKPFNKEVLLARIKTQIEIKRLKEEFIEVTEENERLMRILSHDLANHLNGILGFSELGLIQAKDNDRISSYFSKIISITENTSELINYIREIITIENRGKRIALHSRKIGDFIQSAINTFEHSLQNKQIELTITGMEEIKDEMILVEPVSFQNYVLNNLISNAIKFSYRNSRITVHLEKNEQVIVLMIRDSGIGIKPKTLEKLFSACEHISTTGTLGEKGTGLGMPLVKKYLEKFDAVIRVESKHIDDYPDEHGTVIILEFKHKKTDNIF
ncbi:MAG: response regulator [Candidatus Cloacimonetes bacterium]|nr:response regulator [Candidatus Cloacimonadota bacterium]